MLKRLVSGVAALGLVTAFGVIGASPSSAGGTAPSGQRMMGNTSFSTTTGHFTGGGGTVEPAINDADGSQVYLLTPTNARVHPSTHINPATGMPVNVAPLYLPVYPDGSGVDPATLNCAHVPADNCPDHGPGVAGAAASIDPNVYVGSTGNNLVLGHDHLIGVAKTGGDFNIIWEPVLVLFTSVGAASHRITTLDGPNSLHAVEAAHGAFEVPLPQLDFNCAIVSASVYNNATPAPSVVGP